MSRIDAKAWGAILAPCLVDVLVNKIASQNFHWLYIQIPLLAGTCLLPHSNVKVILLAQTALFAAYKIIDTILHSQDHGNEPSSETSSAIPNVEASKGNVEDVELPSIISGALIQFSQKLEACGHSIRRLQIPDFSIPANQLKTYLSLNEILDSSQQKVWVEDFKTVIENVLSLLESLEKPLEEQRLLLDTLQTELTDLLQKHSKDKSKHLLTRRDIEGNLPESYSFATRSFSSREELFSASDKSLKSSQNYLNALKDTKSLLYIRFSLLSGTIDKALDEDPLCFTDATNWANFCEFTKNWLRETLPRNTEHTITF